MGKGKSNSGPKVRQKPNSDNVRTEKDPENYLKMKPVWRFADIDWDGSWGRACFLDRIENIQGHIQNHLSSFETMTWEEILRAAGGKGEGKGNNSHSVSVDKFKPEVRERLKEKGIAADTLFSLRLDQGTRLYGVRENNCLRIVFFDPYHKDRDRCAYDFD